VSAGVERPHVHLSRAVGAGPRLSVLGIVERLVQFVFEDLLGEFFGGDRFDDSVLSVAPSQQVDFAAASAAEGKVFGFGGGGCWQLDLADRAGRKSDHENFLQVLASFRSERVSIGHRAVSGKRFAQ